MTIDSGLNHQIDIGTYMGNKNIEKNLNSISNIDSPNMSAATKQIKLEKFYGLVNQDTDKKLNTMESKNNSNILNTNKRSGVLQGDIENGEGVGQGRDTKFGSSGLSDDYQKLLNDEKYNNSQSDNGVNDNGFPKHHLDKPSVFQKSDRNIAKYSNDDSNQQIFQDDSDQTNAKRQRDDPYNTQIYTKDEIDINEGKPIPENLGEQGKYSRSDFSKDNEGQLVDRETLELESYYKLLKKELDDLKNEKAPIQQDEQILTTIKEIIRTASENNNSNLVMQQQQFFQFMMQQQQQQMLLQQTQYQNNVNPGMGYPFQNNNPMINSQ
jgi:hypothetical protein